MAKALPVLAAFVVLLLCASSYAQLENLFLNSIYPNSTLKKEVTSTVTVVSSSSSPLCNSGMVQFCKYEKKNVTEVYINRTIFSPYADQEVVKLTNLDKYDGDDKYTLATYDTTELEACGASAKSITDVFACAVQFNKETENKSGNCRTSTSAFKIAFLKSPLYKTVKGNSTDENFTLKKVYVWDPIKFNAHRFITLENNNGVYVLDALWCKSGNMTDCIKQATKRFYEDKSSVNYRGIVYKEDTIY